MPPAAPRRARRRPATVERSNPGSFATAGRTAGRLADEFVLTDVVSHLLRRAHFRAEDLFAEEFARDHLTPRQKALLVTVYQHPGANQNELAERIALDRNSLAEMLARMVALGYLARTRATEDGRVNRVYITTKGVDLLRRVMPRDAEVERRVIAPLPPEYRAQFVKCLKLMVGLES